MQKKKSIFLTLMLVIPTLMFSVSCQKKLVDITPEPVAKEEPKVEPVIEKKPEPAPGLTSLYASVTEDYKVKHLVRDFFNTKESDVRYSQPYYGYYSYLIFTDSTKYKEERRAAAKAFICGLADIDEMKVKLPKLEHYNFAVFYAFVDNENEPESAQTLLIHYDYPYARYLASEIAKQSNYTYTMDNLAVSIVSYPIPLRYNEKIATDVIQVISLSGRPPKVIEQIIRDFIKSVERPTRWITDENGKRIPALTESEDISIFAENFRNLLGSLGELVLSLTINPEAIAKDLPCQ